MDLATVRTQAEELFRRVARARADAAAGVRNGLDFAAICEDFPDTASFDALSMVREQAAKSEGKRRQRLEALAFGLYDLLEARASSHALAHAQHLEVSQSITGTAGESLSLRTALWRMPRVTHRQDRQKLAGRIDDAIEKLDDPFARRLDGSHGASQRSGFTSSLAARQQLSKVDLHALGAECVTFLDATRATYTDVLTWWLRREGELRLFPNGAEQHDLLHFLRLPRYEGAFPSKLDLGPTMTRRFEAMGLDPLADKRIAYDDAERDHKLPGAFALAIDPPSTRLVVRPDTGAMHARAFLQALGESQALAATDPDRPFEDRLLGDRAVPEAMGELFATWLVDRKWLEKVLDLRVPDLVRLLGLVELFRLRRLAALHLHELDRAQSGVTRTLGARYAERMSAALLAKWPESGHFRDLAEPFAAARSLRASMLATSLLTSVREACDEDWWQNPRAGAWVAKVGEQGGLEAAEELAKRLGRPMALGAVGKRLDAICS